MGRITFEGQKGADMSFATCATHEGVHLISKGDGVWECPKCYGGVEEESKASKKNKVDKLEVEDENDR